MKEIDKKLSNTIENICLPIFNAIRITKNVTEHDIAAILKMYTEKIPKFFLYTQANSMLTRVYTTKEGGSTKLYIGVYYYYDLTDNKNPVIYFNENTPDSPVWSKINDIPNSTYRNNHLELLNHLGNPFVTINVHSSNSQALTALEDIKPSLFVRQEGVLKNIILPILHSLDLVDIFKELDLTSYIKNVLRLPVRGLDKKIEELIDTVSNSREDLSESMLMKKFNAIMLFIKLYDILYKAQSNAKNNPEKASRFGSLIIFLSRSLIGYSRTTNYPLQSCQEQIIQNLQAYYGNDWLIFCLILNERLDVDTLAKTVRYYEPIKPQIDYWLNQKSQAAFAAIKMHALNNIPLDHNTLAYKNILGDSLCGYKFASKSVFRLFLSCNLTDMSSWFVRDDEKFLVSTQITWHLMNLFFSKYPQQNNLNTIPLFSNLIDQLVRSDIDFLNLPNRLDILKFLYSNDYIDNIIIDFIKGCCPYTNTPNHTLITTNTSVKGVYKMHDKWVKKINNHRHETLLNNPDSIEQYFAINYEGTGDVKFKQITNELALLEEGRIMEHCCVSYHKMLMSGSYLIYSALAGCGERATLGISYRNTNEEKFRLDQIYSIKNQSVSSKMHEAAITFIDELNHANITIDLTNPRNSPSF